MNEHDSAASPSLRATALVVANEELAAHVHELKENWSPRIAEYLKEVGVGSPAPWCAAFCNFVARQAAKRLGVESPLEKVPNQAYVQSYYEHGKKLGWIVPAEAAEPGDLFLLFFPSLHRYAHIGLVATKPLQASSDGGEFSTIEGNTDADGGREGIEVARRIRKVTPRVVFMRWSA